LVKSKRRKFALKGEEEESFPKVKVKKVFGKIPRNWKKLWKRKEAYEGSKMGMGMGI